MSRVDAILLHGAYIYVYIGKGDKNFFVNYHNDP